MVEEKKQCYPLWFLSYKVMIYIFIIYPLLGYEYLIGKDSDSFTFGCLGNDTQSDFNSY